MSLFRTLIFTTALSGLAMFGCQTTHSDSHAAGGSAAQTPAETTVAVSTPAAPEEKKIDPAMFAKPGFYTFIGNDGRLWVFREGSDEAKTHAAEGKLPVNQVILPNAGPMGLTIRSTDRDIINDYLITKPGFYTFIGNDGRLWVFREGSDEAKAHAAEGKLPVNQVILPNAGPMGLTVRSTYREIINDYLITKPGFYTFIGKDGRLWVFREGSAEAKAHAAEGKLPVNQVILPNAGPMGLTIRSTYREIIDAYLAW